MMRAPEEDDQTLDYARGAAEPTERSGWIGLLITLGFCLLAAIIFLCGRP